MIKSDRGTVEIDGRLSEVAADLAVMIIAFREHMVDNGFEIGDANEIIVRTVTMSLAWDGMEGEE